VSKPNVLFIMTDQQRFDTIAALGNSHIYTPNLDRLVRRGVAFRHAYSTCPVCVPARYTIRTGRFSPTTRFFSNGFSGAAGGQSQNMEERCGPYLARTMSALGYRTFGVGKFHTSPWDEELGYDFQTHSEELYGSPDQRSRDGYSSWIAREYPEYDYIEQLMGERTEMYYMAQTSNQPAGATVEGWAADRAVEQINSADDRPYFGMVSFIGPHPPFAPPIPFNRMYDPDRMSNPVRGCIETDHMDEMIPWMNHIIWAEDINDPHARILKARYYGEISYIDQCVGRILDCVEARDDADNTLICFFADHGDHLGDHHGWQKESYFEGACHVPFLLSWPQRLDAGDKRDELVCLADLFAIATHAAGETETRDGLDILGVLEGAAKPRDFIVGMYETPGCPFFKVMVRARGWKYIYMANGAREQLFDMAADPDELNNAAVDNPEKVRRLRDVAVRSCRRPDVADALDGDDLREFPYRERERGRIYQFDTSRDVKGFPENPQDVLKGKF